MVDFKYHVRPDKRQHDMLACRDGLIQLGLLNEESYLIFESMYPFNTGLNGNMTQWGSTYKATEYRNVLVAIDWKV